MTNAQQRLRKPFLKEKRTGCRNRIKTDQKITCRLRYEQIEKENENTMSDWEEKINSEVAEKENWK